MRTLKTIEPLIVIVEMVAFLVFSELDLLTVMLFTLGIHPAMVLQAYNILGVGHVKVVSPPDREQYMHYGTFYHVVCPLALLFSLAGWSPTLFLLAALLFLMALPDLRINYYMAKRMVYRIPAVRGLVSGRAGRRESRRSHVG